MILLVGFFYENISEARDRRFNPMGGTRVDIGGYELHLRCSGEGNPAVVFDSGLGDSYASWWKVRPQIARVTRACSYDRGGIGFSDSSPHPRTSRVLAEELHTLLHNVGIAPPYILVGHSMAGFDVRIFTSLYPKEVAGIVLVDSSHPDQQKRFPPAINDMDRSWMREAEFFEFTMPFGIPRLLGFCGHDVKLRTAECNFHTARESVAELKNFSESARQTAATGSLGDLPLVVLSHDPNKPQPDLPADLDKITNEDWSQMQQELTHLSTRSTQVVAEHSGHYIQLDRPELVIQGVLTVLNEARGIPAAAPPMFH